MQPSNRLRGYPETKVVMVYWDAGSITLMSTVDLDLELDAKALTTPATNGSSPEGSWQKVHLLRGEPKTIAR